MDGEGTAAGFNGPSGIAMSSTGTLFVADTYNNKIRAVNASGWVTTFAGSGAAGHANGQGVLASFNGPVGVAVSSMGTVFVADTGNNIIRAISPGGLVSMLAGSGAPGNSNGQVKMATFYRPCCVAVSFDGSAVFVASDDTGSLSLGMVRLITSCSSSGSVPSLGTASPGSSCLSNATCTSGACLSGNCCSAAAVRLGVQRVCAVLGFVPHVLAG